MLATLALASSLWAASQESRPCLPADGCVQGPGLVPVERIADDFAKDLAWVVRGNAADLLSTAWAIRKCPTCYESNRLGPDAESRIALKMGSAAGTGLILWEFRRKGHGRAATVLRWVSVGINAGLTINNSVHALRRK